MDNETNVDEPLIQNCPDCGLAMDVSDVEPLSAIVCPNCGAPTTVSTLIDHFQLVDMLGHGGMGAVYKAHDLSLDRLVALKLLRKSSGTAEQIRQLETEAAITASINHPHVVRVFSTGMDHGRFYIAMELVEKGTLDKLIELQGRVAEAQVLEVGAQIASGLRAAHQAGLIHRDVKPGNILFSDAHTAKIVDFGLAIFAEDEAKVRGEIWGTPYYVAPEKLDNKPEDFRSDIYSLGGTLFHALAGRPPFEAENASLVALKHLKSQAVSLQAFAPHISSNTNYVINRMLNKDPDQRYQSYDELIEHLEYASNELAAGRGKVGEKRVVLESAEQKTAMGWLSMAMVVVLLGLIGLGVYFRDQLFSGGGSGAEAKKGSALVTDAVNQLAAGNPDQAVQTLNGVAAHKPAQPWENWVDMLLGLAQYTAGHQSEAGDAFQRVESRGPYSKSDTEQGLANFFVETSKQMTSEHPIDPNAVKTAGPGSFAPAAWLFYAVKDWQIGDIDDAATLFRRFRQTEFTGSDAWLDGLKPMATDYVEQQLAFQMAADHAKSAKSIDDRRKARDQLKDIKGKLAPRAKDLVAKVETDLARVEKERSQALAAGKVPDGRYRLLNRKTGKTIEVEGHSRDDGHKLQEANWSGAGNQQWFVATQPNGFAILTSVESGKAINVPAGKNEDGVGLVQANSNRAITGQWKIEKADGPYFKLTVESSGKVLAIGGPNPGAPIIQTTYTGAQEQQWKIEGL